MATKVCTLLHVASLNWTNSTCNIVNSSQELRSSSKWFVSVPAGITWNLEWAGTQNSTKYDIVEKDKKQNIQHTLYWWKREPSLGFCTVAPAPTQSPALRSLKVWSACGNTCMKWLGNFDSFPRPPLSCQSGGQGRSSYAVCGQRWNPSRLDELDCFLPGVMLTTELLWQLFHYIGPLDMVPLVVTTKEHVGTAAVEMVAWSSPSIKGMA